MFTNVSLLSACIFAHNFDTLCLSETYFNSEIPSDDENWEILGYNLAKEDQPSNSKLIGVCIYYKSLLSFKAFIGDFNAKSSAKLISLSPLKALWLVQQQEAIA